MRRVRWHVPDQGLNGPKLACELLLLLAFDRIHADCVCREAFFAGLAHSDIVRRTGLHARHGLFAHLPKDLVYVRECLAPRLVAEATVCMLHATHRWTWHDLTASSQILLEQIDHQFRLGINAQREERHGHDHGDLKGKNDAILLKTRSAAAAVRAA